jgi:uncharacterized protein YgiM (DUF1202 family)
MSTQKKFPRMLLSLVVGLLLVTSACIPIMPEAVNQATLEAGVERTLTALSIFQTATALVEPADATPTPVSTDTVQPTATEATATSLPSATQAGGTSTPPATVTPGVGDGDLPTVSVSIATNCRSGPDRSFDLLGGLLPNESARVVGQAPSLNYYVIENPDGPGTCWLWGGYATISGNISNVPVVTAPTPPATPRISTSVNIACYTGPSEAMDVVGILDAGQSAEIIGRTYGTIWWLINNPDGAGRCWISSQNASVSGNLGAPPVVPTPQGVPQATNTPALTSTAISGGSGAYSCTITQYTPDFGANFNPNAEFDARWTVRNSGTSSWQTGQADFRFYSGTQMQKYEDIYDLGETVDPGETVQIIVDMQAPSSTGRYSTSWALRVGSNTFCVMPITIDVVQ